MNTADFHKTRIGLVVSTEHVYTRGILRGILEYAAGKPDWVISGGMDAAHATTVFKRWRPDGLIVWTLERQSLGLRIPTVAVLDPYGRAPRIALDNRSIGRLALNHFYERGFRNLAFCGYGADNWWSRERLEGFDAAIRALGVEGVTFSQLAAGIYQPHRWSSAEPELIEWLRRLPKPVGVLAANDYRGLEIVDGCRAAGLRVPEDVTVLGVDDGELVCRMAVPPLSSVVFPWANIGRKAAILLNSLLQGHAVPGRLVRVPAERVAVRESTDMLAVPDRAVCEAYRFIRAAVPGQFHVSDVARQAGVSRRILEIRYRKHLRRSVHADIVTARLGKAMELLRRTSLSIAEIAERGGFSSTEYMAKVFAREMKISPREYRKTDAMYPLPHVKSLGAGPP